MRVINARNVHDALPLALHLLEQTGVERPSRNGPVLVGPSVTTVYERPLERVLFWPARDANPFYHLYEALWMLAGRNDVEPLVRYAKNAINYSDDGKIWYGAYGKRWREFGDEGMDQLAVIAERLRHDPNDRRSVLQMWDANWDLGHLGKDVPCNTIATLQRGTDGALNLTVFCRSNDIIWGAYGANAVQFSLLLEYLALWIDCPVGTYTQISVNWHAYLDTYEKVKTIRPDPMGHVNPYAEGRVHSTRLFHGYEEQWEERLAQLLFDADTGFEHEQRFNDDEPFFDAAYCVLRAHHEWKTRGVNAALDRLLLADQSNDWVTAAREWMLRRKAKSQMRQILAGDLGC